MKYCKSCGLAKESNCFRKNKKRADGLCFYCKDCDSAKKRKHYRENREKILARNVIYHSINKDKKSAYNKLWRAANPRKKKNIALRRDFDITLEQYEGYLFEQNNKCKICQQPETVKTKDGKVKDLAVDHNHLTGKVRGLLCQSCNVALGLIKDNPDIAIKLSEYLKRSA
jgi:hypothetical protein